MHLLDLLINKTVEKMPELLARENIKERLNFLKEAIKDDIEQLELSKDKDAKVSHKTKDTSFFG
ncbi:MAG: hypothetical protein FH753_14295 [Firmicutes bacterium]|nr:hypothetical protein [Bacillota bacterium]